MHRTNSRFRSALPHQAGTIRNEMRFAGSWYPDDEERLRALLAQQIASGSTDRTDTTPQTIPDTGIPPASTTALGIFPHAGLRYAARGQRATAAALRAAGWSPPATVLLVSPSHYYPVPADTVVGAPFAAHETPLGDVPGCTQPVGDRIEPQWIAAEHGVELLLPIMSMSNAQPVITLLCGPITTAAACRAMAGRIVQQLDDARVTGSLLIAVSSDATHYGRRFRHQPMGDAPWESIATDVEARDRALVEEALNGTVEAYLDSIAASESTVCGRYALALGCAVQERWDEVHGGAQRRAWRGAVADYYSSAVITGDSQTSEFVCYCSAVRFARSGDT